MQRRRFASKRKLTVTLTLVVGAMALVISACSNPFDTKGTSDGSENGATLTVSVTGLGTPSAQRSDTDQGFVAQGLQTSQIQSAEITVDGPGVSSSVTNTVSLTGGAGSASFSGVPTGPNRVIKAVGFDSNGNQIPGAEIYASADIYPGNNSVSVNWASTPRGIVFWELLNSDRSNGTNYAANVDPASVQTVVENVISNNGVGHPSLINASSLASDIVSNSGSVPSASSGYIEGTGMVNLVVTGLSYV